MQLVNADIGFIEILQREQQRFENLLLIYMFPLDFPATVYGGTKSIIISTRTVMGGKNPFLGIAYVVVSGICILLGALFTVTHLIKPRFVPFFFLFPSLFSFFSSPLFFSFGVSRGRPPRGCVLSRCYAVC